MNVVLTGSNGFLGSHLCRTITNDPANTLTALVRHGASLKRISNISNLKIERIDYTDSSSISKSLEVIKSKIGKVDLFIHNAGVTHSTDPQAFTKGNTILTENVLKALENSELLGSDATFVYVSSMAAVGPRGADGPVSAYGASKLAAESILKKLPLQYLIMRPAGIYGSGDLAFLPLFKSIKWRLYPCIPPVSQQMNLIHGHDAAEDIWLIAKQAHTGAYHIEGKKCYDHRELKSAMDSAFGRKSVLLNIPMSIVKKYLRVSDFFAKWLGFQPTITFDKFNEVSQDWNVDKPKNKHDFTRDHVYSLDSGIAETLAYYQHNNLL